MFTAADCVVGCAARPTRRRASWPTGWLSCSRRSTAVEDRQLGVVVDRIQTRGALRRQTAGAEGLQLVAYCTVTELRGGRVPEHADDRVAEWTVVEQADTAAQR